MTYIVRFLAAIPMIAVGISALLAFIFSFDSLWFLPLCIGNILAFIVLSDFYEETVKELKNLFEILSR